MPKLPFLCGLVALVMAAQAGAVESMIDSFNDGYVSGPIGPMPANWTFFGYGPPAYSSQELGIVLPPNDGSNSSWRVNLPGSGLPNPVGTIAIYKAGVSLDTYALPGIPIDWNYPVYLKVDVYGADYSENYGPAAKWKQTLDMQGYTRTDGVIEWGWEGGVGNSQWATLTTTIDPGQGGKTGNLILFLDFDLTGITFDAVNAAIWENLRIEYTPEPAGLLLMGSLLGLSLIRRRR